MSALNARKLGVRRMGKKISAGILLYRVRNQTTEIFLVHPGGPYWARKDDGAWSIPKGEVAEGADLLATALAEFEEETGSRVSGETVPLQPLTQAGGKPGDTDLFLMPE